jgi:hypothetical protein
VPLLVWNLKVNSVTQELVTGPCPEIVEPTHASTPPFFKINFNVIFLSSSKSQKWPLHSRYSRTLACFSYVCHPSHSSWFDYPTIIWWRNMIMKCSLHKFRIVNIIKGRVFSTISWLWQLYFIFTRGLSVFWKRKFVQVNFSYIWLCIVLMCCRLHHKYSKVMRHFL